MQELMNIDEVAEYLRVPVPTLRVASPGGPLCAAIKVGRRLVWVAEYVKMWAEVHREGSAA